MDGAQRLVEDGQVLVLEDRDTASMLAAEHRKKKKKKKKNQVDEPQSDRERHAEEDITRLMERLRVQHLEKEAAKKEVESKNPSVSKSLLDD